MSADYCAYKRTATKMSWRIILYFPRIEINWAVIAILLFP